MSSGDKPKAPTPPPPSVRLRSLREQPSSRAAAEPPDDASATPAAAPNERVQDATLSGLGPTSLEGFGSEPTMPIAFESLTPSVPPPVPQARPRRPTGGESPAPRPAAATVDQPPVASLEAPTLDSTRLGQLRARASKGATLIVAGSAALLLLVVVLLLSWAVSGDEDPATVEPGAASASAGEGASRSATEAPRAGAATGSAAAAPSQAAPVAPPVAAPPPTPGQPQPTSVAGAMPAPDEVQLPPVPRRVQRMRPQRRQREAQDLLDRAQRRLRRHEYEPAATAFREALVYAPESPAAAHGLAASLLPRSSTAGEALPWARRAARLEPQEVSHHVLLADALRRAGDTAGAAAALEEAIRLDPRNRVLKRRLARLRREP